VIPVLLWSTSTASAGQWGRRQPFAVSERPSAGLFLGAGINGDSEKGGGASPEGGFVFDAPVVFGKRIRFDAIRTSWHAENVGYRGAVIAADRITMTTVMLSLVSVRHQSAHVAGYGGFGAGAYRYDFERARPTHPWKGGIHGLLGMEWLRSGGRSAIDAEIRVHAMGGPQTQPSWQVLMVKLDAAIGMKVRF
jgi:hypothetical protein